MQFADFFAGLGGFHVAARAAGGTCVFASEIDEDLRALYQRNFGLLPDGDITSIPLQRIPKHDLLCAGFPCQPFSKAGTQSGLSDRLRGKVLFRIPEILKEKKPEFVLLENVSHFVRHDSGRTYDKVRRALKNVGYDVDCHEYSPHEFGIPQIRQRIYLVARRGSLGNFQWPSTSGPDLNPCIRTVLESRPSDARPLPDYVVRCMEIWQDFLDKFPKDEKLPWFPIWSMEFKATYPFTKYDSLRDLSLSALSKYRGVFGKSLRAKRWKELGDRLPSYARSEAGTFPDWKQVFIRENRRLYRQQKKWLDRWIPKIVDFFPSFQKFEWHCQGETRNIWEYVVQLRASGIRVKRATTAPSLVAMTTTQVPIIAWEKRFMTIRECARLQSLGELCHLPQGGAGVKAIGNAVNAEVARRIITNLIAS